MSVVGWVKEKWHAISEHPSAPIRAAFALLVFVGTIIAFEWRTLEVLIPFALISIGYTFHLSFYRHRGSPGSGPESTRSMESLDRREVYERLKGGFPGNPSVLTGQAGAGKSRLIERLARERASASEAWAVVREYFGRQCRYVRVTSHDSPTDQKSELRENLDVVLGRHRVIVFDQFERILMSRVVAEETLEVLGRARSEKIVGLGQAGSGERIFVVRREWLADVSALLGDLTWARVFYVPALTSSSPEWIDLSQPVSALSDPGVREKLFRQMATRGGIVGSLAPDGRLQEPEVSLVSAVMACNVVTWLSASQKQGEWDRNVDSLWRLYFREMAAASGDFHDAMRVFFALSVFPVDRARTIADLAYATSLSSARVDWVVTRLLDSVLRKGGLDRSTGQANDEGRDWSHDVYAEEFNALSGGFVRAEDQQNIVYFLHRAKRGDRRPDDSPMDDVIRRKRGFSLGCFLAAMVVLLWRCFMPVPLYGDVPPAVFSPPLFGSEARIDWAFTAIAISLSLWAYYIHRLVWDVFAHTPERGWASRLTYAMSFFSLVFVLASAVWPGWWLALAALGALFVGGKFVLVPAPAHGGGGRGTRAPEFFRGAGWSTLGAAVLAGFAGWAFKEGVDGQSCEGWPLRWSLVTFIGGIFWAVWFCIRQHVGPKKAPTLLGTCRRAWIEHRSLLESSRKEADPA